MTAAIEVTVVNVGSWTARPDHLADILGRAGAGHVIADPTGAPADADGMATVVDPMFWSVHPGELADALGAPRRTPQVGRASGAVAPVADRLTLTVEEAAALLGISRAFAYEAVRRGEIPSIRIGRRVLVPRVALDRLVSGEAQPAAREED